MGSAVGVLRERVADAVTDGASLEEVDAALIEPAPLPADLRDAVWLDAWGLSEQPDTTVVVQRAPSA
jgi:hypothetical protein